MELDELLFVVNGVLGGGILSNIDVGHDTDVPVHVKLYFTLSRQ